VDSLKMGLKMEKDSFIGLMDLFIKEILKKIRDMVRAFLNQNKVALKVNGRMIKYKEQDTL
jgi:hypothetical protein